MAKMTFDDEFNKLDLGAGPWKPAISWAPNGSTDSTLSSWSMNPAWGPTSAADADVFSDANGVLKMDIKPTPADVKESDVGNAQFLSGQLTSQGSFSQTYGYFEMNAKLGSGAGVNSAFWLLPQDGSWPPELDIEEVLGQNPATVIDTAHSQAGGSNTANPHWSDQADTSKSFHTYAVDWEADKITWYFDGKQTAQEATPADMDKPMYMLLSNMTGSSSSWMGAPAAGLTTDMQVDWVHVYDSNPYADGTAPAAAPAAAPPAPSAPATSPAVTPAPTPVVTDTSGTHPLALLVSEDAYKGDAQYTVSVDGTQVGGVRTAHASHAAGAEDTVTLNGSWVGGSHSVAISFINDAWDGTAATDRNLYVDGVSYDGNAVAGASAALYGNEAKSFSFPGAKAGQTLTLHLSEDAYQGDAKYTVSVDGKAMGAEAAVTASHAAGKSQDVSFDLGAGPHDVAVTFTNDAWGGSGDADRNLYVNSLDFNGKTTPGAALYGAGTRHFQVG